MPEVLVVDASALVEFLADSALGVVVGRRLQEGVLHAPASLDLEVLSGLGRLHRKDRLSVRQVATRLDWLNRAPIACHLLGPLVAGAWQKRHRVSLPEALYVELAETAASASPHHRCPAGPGLPGGRGGDGRPLIPLPLFSR